jgi:hypothetical protein
LEGGGVLRMAVQSSGLAGHGFDHLGDCHTCNEISLMSLEMQWKEPAKMNLREGKA